jgi:hypothetical protein
MRQHTELALGAGVVFVLAVTAGLVGVQRAQQSDIDPRRSTYLAGPSGARGFAEALGKLGVRVDPFRRRTGAYEATGAPRTLFAVLDPTTALSPEEGLALAGLRTDVLVAGLGAGTAFRCLGWDVRARRYDSLAVAPPPGAEARRFPRPRAVLVKRDSAVAVDSAGAEDSAPVRCTAPTASEVDTLLRTTTASPSRCGSRSTTVVAPPWSPDGRLFTNRALRETAAGPFVLGLVVPRYDRMIVDEYHHGYDASQSLGGATIGWTLQSPWGWAILQLAGVGLMRCSRPAFGSDRSGRASSGAAARPWSTCAPSPPRWPPREGTTWRCVLIVQGLRRRLSATGRTSPGAVGPWLDGLAPAVRSPAGRTALETLQSVSHRSASAEDVLRAADAVETLWEELTPT